MAGKGPKEIKKKQRITPDLLWKQRYLLMMSLPFVIWLIIFKYIPLWGWTMAFQEVKPATFAIPVWERPFAGFQNFIKAFQDRLFAQTMVNTIGISILQIAVGTVVAIAFAVLLNELVFTRFKKITQTISYLPHFVSWVIIASIAKNIFNDGGVIDSLVGANLHLMSTNSPLIWMVIVIIDCWKEMGWNAIIYLSSMAGIDPGLYEAAQIDGAGRWSRIKAVTLPGIRPIIMIQLLMNVGNVLNAGFEVQYLLGNGLVQSVSQTIDIYVLKWGISQGDYAIGTAAGIFKSVVSIILIVAANQIAKRSGEERLF